MKRKERIARKETDIGGILPGEDRTLYRYYSKFKSVIASHFIHMW